MSDPTASPIVNLALPAFQCIVLLNLLRQLKDTQDIAGCNDYEVRYNQADAESLRQLILAADNTGEVGEAEATARVAEAARDGKTYLNDSCLTSYFTKELKTAMAVAGVPVAASRRGY